MSTANPINLNKVQPAAVAPSTGNRLDEGLKNCAGFDMTQEEFARRISVSQSDLSLIERGRVEAGAQVLLAISRECQKTIECGYPSSTICGWLASLR